MDSAEVETLMLQMQEIDSRELLHTWHGRDSDECTSEVIEAVRRVLEQRGVNLGGVAPSERTVLDVVGKPAPVDNALLREEVARYVCLSHPIWIELANGNAVLESKYVLPGNGWRAVCVSAVAYTLVVIGVQQLTGYLPGFLYALSFGFLFYVFGLLIIRLARPPRKIRCNLKAARSIVLDRDAGTVNLLLPLNNEYAWAGLAISAEDQTAFDAIAATPGLPLRIRDLGALRLRGLE